MLNGKYVDSNGNYNGKIVMTETEELMMKTYQRRLAIALWSLNHTVEEINYLSGLTDEEIYEAVND